MIEMKQETEPNQGSNVVALRRLDAAAPLTPDECRRLRALLADFEAIAMHCPIARSILDRE